jgi:stalled ribosome alternative rescue factor ArfA
MKLFMKNSDEVFPGLRDIDMSDVDVMECIQRNDGEFNAHYGLKHTEETRKIMSEHAKLRVGDKNAFYGRQHSQESKGKMSESAKLRTGDKNSFFGKQHSDETRMKISKSKKGKPSYIRTEEHRQKMSEIIKRRKACTNTSAKLEEL